MPRPRRSSRIRRRRAIYVYRSRHDRWDEESVLHVDHRLIGSTRPGGYFWVDVNPGTRRLQGITYDQGVLDIEVRPGEIYFVALTVMGGSSHFRVRPAAIGRADLVDCCVLVENWAPGQRPLLR